MSGVSAVVQRPPKSSGSESTASWPIQDRIGYYACWVAGVALCTITAAIVIYLFVRGIQYLRPELLIESPQSTLSQAEAGGFLDPIIGTLLLTTIGTAIALPLGVAIAVWLSEYGRPTGLARAVESCVEVVAGTPSIVLAIFGLLLFSNTIFSPLSFEAQNGEVFGRSFLIAGTMMSLIALPLVVGGTREALQSIPGHVREASYALGKTKIATIRRVLVPAARPGIATGTALGMGRIIGDTAIVVVLLGFIQIQAAPDSLPGVGVLQGTGSTLTSYVYNNSPAGEGGAPEKAYAAAFVLLMIVIGMNFVVDLIARNRRAPVWIR